MEGSGRGTGGCGGRGPPGGRGRGGQPQHRQRGQYPVGGRGGYGGAGGHLGGSGPSNPQYPQQFPLKNPYIGGRGSDQSGGSVFIPIQQYPPQGLLQDQLQISDGDGRVVGYGGRGPVSGRGYGRGWGQNQPASAWGNPSGGEGRGDGSSAGVGALTYIPIQSQKSPESDPESACSEMQLLGISARHFRSSDPRQSIKRVPVRRPDRGGQNYVRTCNLLVNHYPVKFNREAIIMHYDVDIKEDRPSESGHPGRAAKSDMGMIRKKLLSDNSWGSMLMTAYDGQKNIFSPDPLPTGTFLIKLSEEEDLKKRSFVMTIKLVNELKACKLNDYLIGKPVSIPRDILQGMDLVMKEKPARELIHAGRSFYSGQFFPSDDLGHGIEVYRGFQHSLKPTASGLALCLDYSVMAFRKPAPVIAFLHEHIHGFSLINFHRFWNQVEEALIGLKVMAIHRRTKQKYTIAGLADMSTRLTTFPLDDPNGVVPLRKISLVDYFREKYSKEIKEKDIPALNLGKGGRLNYVPMEFCVLAEGQVYPKEKLERLDKNAAKLLKKISLAQPLDRRNIIQSMVMSDHGPFGGGIAKKFGMEIDANMPNVKGRVINAPRVKLGPRGVAINVHPEKRHWNLVKKSVMEGMPLHRWGVVDFSASDRYNWLNASRFIPALIARCRSLGIQTEEPLFYKPAKMSTLSNVPQLHELLENASLEQGRLQLLLCVMTERHGGYKHLKWISEAQLGLVTQCCLSGEANKTCDQTLANLALKFNAKLGGSNFELANPLPHFETNRQHIMIVGADVNHPAARNVTSPSIAAVVATMNWPATNRYATRISVQEHRKERILNFGDMCGELVDAYAAENGARPAKIIMFRDGVSEAQSAMVLNEELADLQRAFRAKSYCPTITLTVARKRHQTRFFPASRNDGGDSGNMHPGTVVDTQVVYPSGFDFYLCSHYGMIGTSKVTHYHVLWDDHNFGSDEMQQLIYNLCFMFVRCTKPVSVVPPVFYADLAAYRGRLYHEALMEGAAQVPLAGSMYKLHGDIMNSMFFV